MSKPKISVRLSEPLLGALNQYAEDIGTSRSDVIATAIAQYLDFAEEVPLIQRMAEIEKKVEKLESEIRGEATNA